MSAAEEQIQSFARDGFVVVPELLTREERERFGAAVDDAVAFRSRRDKRKLADRTRYEQSFRQCINLWEDFAEVRPLSFHPRIAETAAQLLAVPAVRIWHDQALYKEADGRETDPHQDQPYWPIEEPRTVTAWIPFDGSTTLNGCMGYIPGSHKIGLRKFANIFSGSGYDLDALPEVRERKPVYVEVPPGAVAFHHGLTIHLAHPNRSSRTRRVHTVIFFADGCTRRAGHPHPSVDRAGIEPGQPVASSVTPIAWPRPNDALPDPPPLPEPLIPAWPGWPA